MLFRSDASDPYSDLVADELLCADLLAGLVRPLAAVLVALVLVVHGALKLGGLGSQERRDAHHLRVELSILLKSVEPRERRGQLLDRKTSCRERV